MVIARGSARGSAAKLRLGDLVEWMPRGNSRHSFFANATRDRTRYADELIAAGGWFAGFATGGVDDEESEPEIDDELDEEFI